MHRPRIERVEVAAYRIPTDFPESDGTLKWDSTTLVAVHATAGDRRGFGYSYADTATACLIHDVIARLPGAVYPDEWIVRGNHHDAWVNGAEDPSSGMAAELEEARALGELVRRGWRPKRTIVYAAWDGEEPGLLGSTEWVEAHGDELARKAVVYLNSDSNGRGFLDARPLDERAGLEVEPLQDVGRR